MLAGSAESMLFDDVEERKTAKQVQAIPTTLRSIEIECDRNLP